MGSHGLLLGEAVRAEAHVVRVVAVVRSEERCSRRVRPTCGRAKPRGRDKLVVGPVGEPGHQEELLQAAVGTGGVERGLPDRSWASGSRLMCRRTTRSRSARLSTGTRRRSTP